LQDLKNPEDFIPLMLQSPPFVGADAPPCEVWGKKAEAASELEAGMPVVFEGRLKKRQRGEQWELIVSGFEVNAIALLVPA